MAGEAMERSGELAVSPASLVAELSLITPMLEAEMASATRWSSWTRLRRNTKPSTTSVAEAQGSTTPASRTTWRRRVFFAPPRNRVKTN